MQNFDGLDCLVRQAEATNGLLEVTVGLLFDLAFLSQVFMDNGGGMTPETLHKMLGFGHSDKKEIAGHRYT